MFRRTFDPQLGGFGGAPKFPRASVFNFLLRYYARTGNREALDMVLLTLREMAKGGMHDQLGGGFHRYSVDERWFVPHFEKMLYDQAQLAISYLEAFQITGDAQYAETARGIFDYVLRDMTDSRGRLLFRRGCRQRHRPGRAGRQGRRRVLHLDRRRDPRNWCRSPTADWFCYRYGVAEGGNVANDPHEEFAGRNILYRAAHRGRHRTEFRQIEEVVAEALDKARRILLEARANRVPARTWTTRFSPPGTGS